MFELIYILYTIIRSAHGCSGMLISDSYIEIISDNYGRIFILKSNGYSTFDSFDYNISTTNYEYSVYTNIK